MKGSFKTTRDIAHVSELQAIDPLSVPIVRPHARQEVSLKYQDTV